MCVIAHCEKQFPTLEELQKMQRSNNAGGGVAWYEDNKVKWHKGVSAKQIYAILSTAKLPAVIHFRLATVGGPSSKLCHPFPITENSELYLSGSIKGGLLFHNGHISEWAKYVAIAGIRLPHGAMSDTRAIACILGARRNWDMLRAIDGKFVTIEPDGVTRYGSFEEKNGVHYSNLFWDYQRVGKGTGTYFDGNDWRDDYHRPYVSPAPMGTHLNGVKYKAGKGGGHDSTCCCNKCMDEWKERQAKLYPKQIGHAGYRHAEHCNCTECRSKKSIALPAAATEAVIIPEPVNVDGQGPMYFLGGVWLKALERPKGHFETCHCVACMEYRNQQFDVANQARLHQQVEKHEADSRLFADDLGTKPEAGTQ